MRRRPKWFHAGISGFARRMLHGVLASLALMLAAGSASAQQTQIQYLSGTDPEGRINWKCS